MDFEAPHLFTRPIALPWQYVNSNLHAPWGLSTKSTISLLLSDKFPHSIKFPHDIYNLHRHASETKFVDRVSMNTVRHEHSDYSCSFRMCCGSRGLTTSLCWSSIMCQTSFLVIWRATVVEKTSVFGVKYDLSRLSWNLFDRIGVKDGLGPTTTLRSIE